MMDEPYFSTTVRLLPRSSLILGVLIALAACGGGGGGAGIRPNIQPPPPQNTDPPETIVEPPNPAYSQHLARTGADEAHLAGFTGAGIRVGIVDSGVNRTHPSLEGRVVSNLVYVSDEDNDLSVDDVVGHGTAVAQALAGRPFGQWPGGIAPDAEIVSARIISDEPPEDDGSGEGNEITGALGLAPIHQDLINRGVRIMNNSWGGVYWTDLGATAPIAEEYRPFIVQHDGLVVFAAGNSAFADPSDIAALPSIEGEGGTHPAADLERGWLAVAALAEVGNVLADYSNACGIAMHYCLAAPGTVIVTGTDDAPDAPEYWKWSGTSLAAPLVSGAAALVWEAFPYFNNDLVRQTLLGTADDLGTAGVDAIYGYGSLNVAAAVKGPARFDWGDVTVDFDGITSTWSNEIVGDGGLIKQGTGTLVLSTTADYLGDTQIEGGTLQVDNRLGSSEVHIEHAGILTGNGYIQSAVFNHGTLAIDEDNALSLDADYTQHADGTLSVQLGVPLLVGGAATLEGGELHVSGVKTDYVTQAKELVLHSGTGLTGTFDTLTSAGMFLDATFDYDYPLHDVSLDITRLDVALAAQSFATATPESLASAQRVESAFKQIDARANSDVPLSREFIRAAGQFQRIQTEAAAVKALSSLSGESHAELAAFTFDAADMNRRTLSSRFGDFAMHDAHPGAWKESFSQGGQDGFLAHDLAARGWSMGRDQWTTQDIMAGFAFGEIRANDQLGVNQDRSRNRQTTGQLYVGKLYNDAYLLGQFGFGQFDHDLDRRLFSGEQWQHAVSDYSGDYTTASVEAGQNWRFGDGTFASYLGAEYTALDNDGFIENGGNGFGLKTNAWRSTRTQAIAGLRAEQNFSAVTLRAYSEWQQVVDADGFDINASFVGIDAWTPLPGMDLTKSGGMFGIGLETWLTRNSRVLLGYDQRFGPRGDEAIGSMTYAIGF